MNVIVVVFAGTVTGFGTVAAAVTLLETVTDAPPDGAVPLRVMVAVELLTPPVTLVELRVREATPVAAAVTVRAALLVPPLNVAEMFAVEVVATA